MVVNEGFDRAEVCAYYNQTSDWYSFSGDITNAPAPHGATEYARIDLHGLPKWCRYIIPGTVSYTQNPFNENCSEAYTAFHQSGNAKFVLSSDMVKIDLVQNSRGNIPFIIDVVEKKVIFIDFNMSNADRHFNSEIGTVKDVVEVLNTETKTTNGYIAEIISDKNGPTKRVNLEEFNSIFA